MSLGGWRATLAGVTGGGGARFDGNAGVELVVPGLDEAPDGGLDVLRVERRMTRALLQGASRSSQTMTEDDSSAMARGGSEVLPESEGRRGAT